MNSGQLPVLLALGMKNVDSLRCCRLLNIPIVLNVFQSNFQPPD